MNERARELPLRPVEARLRGRYLREGLWTDDTLGDSLDRAIRSHGDLELRIWSDQRPTRSTLAKMQTGARALAAALHQRGIGPGDPVAFQLPNWIEAVMAFSGLAMLGATLVPVVHFYGPRELEFILRESGARALLTTDRFRHLDYAAGLADIRAGLPDLELVAMVQSSGDALPTDVVPFTTLLDAPPLAGALPCDPDDAAVIAYTSGTTADPKGVIHTHRSLLAEVRQLAAIQHPGHRPSLVGAPVAHAIGMLAGVLLPLHRGLPIHLTDVWDPAKVLGAMLEADLTAGSGSTFFLLSLLDAPEFGPAHLEKMEWAGLGAAPVPTAVATRAEELGIGVARVYGATEQPSITGSGPQVPRALRNGTDGHPLAGVELKLVDEAGHEVGIGEPGEIISRGPDLFAGYTDPALTADAVDADGWYASGDIGVLDEHGHLTITDRKKDIIIRGGTNISAAEVEELLARMPEVTEVAVVAAPDTRMGERAYAFLRLRPGVSEPDLADVRRHLEAAGLARPKWPEQLEIVGDFPRTPSGKIKKFELRDQLRKTSDSPTSP